jgi:membrane protein YqaA with SNARE-associated domain
MQLLNEILLAATGLMAGAAIGYGFGRFQEMALRRNQERQQKGLLHSGWSLMPGSFTRVALLLIVLASVQAVCPLLFANGAQWWVSGGVIAGYGALLGLQLRRKLAESRQ